MVGVCRSTRNCDRRLMLGFLVVLLSFFKQPLGVGIFLNVLPVLWGATSLFYIRSISVYWLPLLCLLASNFLANLLYQGDAISYARTLQALLLLMFSVYLSKRLEMFDRRFFALVIALAFVLFAIELALNVRYARELFGFAVPRLAGFHGDPNYNSVLIGTMMVLSVFLRRKVGLEAIVLFILLLPGFSRGAFLGAVGFFLTVFAYTYVPRLVRLLSLLLLLALFSQPFVIELLFRTLDNETLILANALSSDRVAHWRAYTDIALDNPLGVGYFVGQNIESAYLNNELFKYVKPQQAHSMYFSTIADFGSVGYFFLFSFFALIYTKVKRSRFRLAALNYLLLAFMSLNFLGEISFWILASVLVSREGFCDNDTKCT